jgi:hypothetical protein
MNWINVLKKKLFWRDNFNAHLRLIANYKMELFDGEGKLKDVRVGHNLVTDLCLIMIADQLLASPSIAKPGWMELGTGSGQAETDSTLAAYISGSRTALDSKTKSDEEVTMVCTFGAGVGTGAVTEAGVFNVVTQNTTDLLLYDDFDVINKLAADTLVVTWKLTVDQSA